MRPAPRPRAVLTRTRSTTQRVQFARGSSVLRCTTTGKRRLADEYDAAQERGEVAKGRPKSIPGENTLQPTADDIAPGFSKDIHEASVIRDAEVADPGVVRRANEAQTRDRGTNGPALTGKMMHRAVAPGPGYSAAIAMPGVAQGVVRSPPPRRAAPSSPAGHGQVPNASMDARSMSTTITFRSDGAGLRSPLVAGNMDHSVAASQRSPAVRFDY